jgi:hypothetical protein
MANVLKRDRQMHVLHLLVNGSSIRAAERVTGIHRDTICRLVVRFGEACREWMDGQMQDLTIRHLELDEQWTYCGKKQARLTVDEKQTRYDQGDIYLWIGIDQETRLVPSFAPGKRSADMARRFTVDLAGRMTRPKPHASDAHAYGKGGYLQRVQISTDGFAAYAEAIDLAFGPYAAHGIIIKEYRNAGMQYDPGEMVGTQRRASDAIDPLDDLHQPRRKAERHDPLVYEAVQPAHVLLQQEAGEPGSGHGDVSGLLQLVLAIPLPRQQRQAWPQAPDARDGRQADGPRLELSGAIRYGLAGQGCGVADSLLRALPKRPTLAM